MAIRDEILTLKNKESTLANNKVCNFAYDDTAFEDDTTVGANGVITYNYNNHNNIPVKDPEILKTNATIISKGFRSQVSTLPRMLLNHIFGRVSYNLNKTVDTFNSLLFNLYNYIGQPNGLATLDNTGRLPYSQLPLSAVEYKGAWNANTNTPTLASGSGTFGDEYIVSTQGTQNLGEGSITYRVGDRVIYNGSIWQRISASSVRTVSSKIPDANGNVTVTAEDMATPDVYGYDRTDMGKAWFAGTPTSIYFFRVYFANGIWVAVAHNQGIWWSTDGVNWTQSNITTDNANAVYYADGIWVVGCSGSDAKIYWSLDGKTWTQGSFAGLTSSSIVSIYNYNSLWIAIGSGIWKSTDGKNWTRPSTGADNVYFVGDVTYLNGLWLAGHNSGMYWSSDGDTWTAGTGQGNYNGFNSFCYANDLWLAGGSTWVYWSTDGKDWHATVPFNASFGDVVYGNGLFVACSYSQGVWWSTDGKNWSRGSNTEGVTITAEKTRSLVYANGLFVAVGRDVWWSTDGKNWIQGSRGGSSSSELLQALYANKMWVATSYYAMYYSVGSLTNNVKTILDWLIYAVDNLLE